MQVAGSGYVLRAGQWLLAGMASGHVIRLYLSCIALSLVVDVWRCVRSARVVAFVRDARCTAVECRRCELCASARVRRGARFLTPFVY
jgi:hypothetical protein